MRVYPLSPWIPRAEFATRVCSPPYDVISCDDARAMVRDEPLHFSQVLRPECFVPAAQAQAHARATWERLRQRAWVRAEPPAFYVWAIDSVAGRQVGLVAACTAEDYAAGRIARHELTRPDKVADRIRHIEAVGAQTGVVYLTVRARPGWDDLFGDLDEDTAVAHVERPDADHRLWRLDDAAAARVEAWFEDVPRLYIADGHHRAEAAATVAGRRGASGAAGAFLTAIFPSDQLVVQAYNRAVRDLAGHTPSSLVEALRERMLVVEPATDVVPPQPGEFRMILADRWWRLVPRPADRQGARIADRLDVAVLQRTILEPLLRIADPRKDPRVVFVGGARSPWELEQGVRKGHYAVGFSLHPTRVDDVLDVADAGEIMPPKSTWFEPKLLSGLVVRPLDD